MVIVWPFLAVNCRSILPLIVPATHAPSSAVEMHAPSARVPSVYSTSPVACTSIGVDVGVIVGFGVGGLGVDVAGFGVGVAGFGVGVRAIVGLGDGVGVGVGDSVTAGASGLGAAEGRVIATLAEGSGDGSG